jgi:ribosomal protein S18 acetylase RimI-like enzyme
LADPARWLASATSATCALLPGQGPGKVVIGVWLEVIGVDPPCWRQRGWYRLRDVQRGSEPPRYDSAVSSSLTVRPARVEDVAQMARVNVRCWQETYRGLMSDAVLDDPGFLAARERFWTAALTDERYRENRVAVAERDGELVGIAMSGPPLDAAAAWARQLYVLYVYAADHGTGAGPALLEAVVDPEESAALWVADPNPRAQAFYRKHGFVADGTAQVEGGVREIRMVRGMQHSR